MVQTECGGENMEEEDEEDEEEVEIQFEYSKVPYTRAMKMKNEKKGIKVRSHSKTTTQ